ncbi:thrombomodulin-like [Lates calcarifer]|uniref:Thrombomodulin n=1 Tax=Lates calcarifer TaxID=8187 RepID=A0AAJ7VEW8_LATCA|nr:thrombomodulin-like [Lates calcarifer]
MIPTTRALLICAAFLCGLEEVVLSQHGHCAGNLCFVLLQKPEDFPGAQKNCKEVGGQLLKISSEEAQKTLPTPLNRMSGSYWLALHDNAGGTTGEVSARLHNCSSISVTNEGKLSVSWKPCHGKLDGFLCQYSTTDLCGRLQAGGGAQVRYITYWGFQVSDWERFPPATIAVAEKVGGKYPNSKHLCFAQTWTRAPWECEVLNGGCDHKCKSSPRTCVCPAGQTLHRNNITCTAKDPCADCAQGCQQEGDSHVCTCRQGYRLARGRKSCVDVDECEERKDLCTGENRECMNTEGGFECTCKDGFVEDDGVCVNNAICEKCEHMLCKKRNGAYRCECREGFSVSAADPTKCNVHCAERDCPADCVYDPDVERIDLQKCYCPDGYIRHNGNDTALCTDINECEMGPQCDHMCENLFGSYRCICHEGFELHQNRCVRVATMDWEEGSGTTSPSYPAASTALPAAVPSYIKTGSVLGISVFIVLCAASLYLLVQIMMKRCGRFELPSFKHPDIDIFYLQQVTTETYKRLSFDKQFKNDFQRQ